MKTATEIVAGFQALATVTEDQFETSLASAISDLQAFINAGLPAPAAPTVTGVSSVISFSDGSTQTFPQA